MQQSITDFFRNFPSAEAVSAHPYSRAEYASLRAQGEAFLQTGLPSLPYADFMLYWRTGDREQYQRLYFDRRGHLVVFSLLAKLEPEQPKWHAALEEAVWGICSEAIWCLPAHYLIADNVPLPYEAYEQCLDLFACETGFALAEALALHRDTLAPLLQTLIRTNVQRRIFTPFADAARPQRFETMTNNWSAVCAGAIGGAALHLLPDAPARSALIERCLSALEVYVDSFGADGICTEGVDYWSYGFGFYVCFADLLARATDGAVNLLAQPRVQAIASSQLAFYLGGTATLSFSDGSCDSRFRMGLSCYLNQRIPDAALPDLACAAPVLKDNCYRYCLAVRDFLWFDASLPFGAQAHSSWYENAQWFVSRKGVSTLAAKAGHNGESHNHNDCGSFVLCRNGALLLCDFGAGLYDAAYFSDARYDIFVNRSQSHNTPLPGGQEQCVGAQHAAHVLAHTFSEQDDVFSTELAHCYPTGTVDSLVRTLRHAKDGTLQLQDEATFSSPDTLTETFVSQTPILLQNGCATFSAQGQAVQVQIPDGWQAQVLAQPYSGHDGLTYTAFVLRLHNELPAPSVSLCLTFISL